jgi:hypothetical protein
MAPESPLPCSKESATDSYPESDESTPQPHILYDCDTFYYYPTIYAWFFSLISFLEVFLATIHTHLSSLLVTYLAHFILLGLLITLSCYFLSNLGPHIHLSTLFWNTLSLCSSLSVTYQVSHSYRTTGKIIITFLNNFI